MSFKHTNADGREKQFSRNAFLESLLKEVNADLSIAEKELLSKSESGQQEFPLILVMGPMRSGTTLFMQWLADTGLISYPTNMLSRFYQAPVVGAKIQLLLTDPQFNFRDELGEFLQQSDYKSNNGKTKGVLAPNEFWYFWRRFLADPSKDVWSDEELRSSMDVRTLKAELSGVMEVFQKPFAAKCMLFNYNIPFLDSVFEKALFVQMRRDPVSNVASVLEARKRQFGAVDEWYSFRIPEYETLQDLDPITQVAGQVHYINSAVEKGMSKVDSSRKLVVQYEDFCENPRVIFEQLVDTLGFDGETYGGPNQFDIFAAREGHEAVQIREALNVFQG